MKLSWILAVSAVAASRPARGAWIETLVSMSPEPKSIVAPRAGRVD